MPRFLKLVLLSFCVALSAHAQSVEELIHSGKVMIEAALKQETAADLFKARAHFERMLSAKQHEALVRYYIAYCDYRYASAYARREQNAGDKMEKYLDDAVAHLEAAVKLDDKFAEAHALLASCYGQQISTNFLLGMTLGAKSSAAMSKALQLEPENPRLQRPGEWSLL